MAFDYIVVNSYNTNLRFIDLGMNALRQRFYVSLDVETTLVAEFNPGSRGHEPQFIFDEIYGPAIGLWQRERPGPVIRIYRVR